MTVTQTRSTRPASRGTTAARFCCFVCLVATLPIYSPNIVTLNHVAVADVTATFARTVIGLPLLAAAALCILSVRRARADAAQIAFKPMFMGAAAGSYFLGCVGYVALMAFGSDWAGAHVCAFICAALAGAGLVPLCVHWASIVRSYELRQLVAFTGLGFLAAAAVNLVLVRLPSPALFVAHAVFLAIAAFAPLLLRSPSKEPPAGQVLPPRLASYCSVMGVPLAGIAISSFVIGVAPTTVLGNSVDTQAIGAILAGLVTLPLALVPTKTPTNIFIRQVGTPVACVVTLAVCALPFLGDEVKLITSYTLLSLVGAVALGTATAISNAHEFPRAFVFATLVGTYCLAAAAGLATGFFLAGTTEFHYVLVVSLAALYCAFTACTSRAAASARPDAARDVDARAGLAAAGPKTGTPDVQTCADGIAERFGLTPREHEILGILAHGHGCAYVADTLLISKNTVYTHARNVYRKLGISSHEELIQLIDRERSGAE